MAFSRDAEQVLAVSARQRVPRYLVDGAAKYSRFAYSSLFGPCLELDAGKAGIVSDSTLVLTDATGERRVRGDAHDFEIDGRLLASTWQPWPDVQVRTVLWGSAPWHIRVHAIRSGRILAAEEFGFGLGYEDDSGLHAETLDRGAVAKSTIGCSGILDPSASRAATSERPRRTRASRGLALRFRFSACSYAEARISW